MKDVPEPFPSPLPTEDAIPSSVDEFRVLKGEIAAARRALVNMILYSDRHGPAQQKLVKETADTVSLHLSSLKVRDGMAIEFQALKEDWEAFKRTRDMEIVPAILAGKKAHYERIAAGIQKERLNRIYALITILGK